MLSGAFKPQVFFNVDKNGRSVWTGTGGGKPAAEKKEAPATAAAASGDHMLTSVETTEAFLNKHGIKFKVSKLR